MYIIMYKYSTFKIKRKSFRSSMSKNFPVIPGPFPVIPGSDRGSHLTGHLLPGLFSPSAHNNY